MIKFHLKLVLIWLSTFNLIVGCEYRIQDLRRDPATPTYVVGPFPNQKILSDTHFTNHCGPIDGLREPQCLKIESAPDAYESKVTESGLIRLIPQKDLQPETLLRRVQRGQDGRRRITDTENLKYRPHGHLEITFKNNDKYSGSGVLVGPHHVLTAGHNLFDHESGLGWATQIIFRPARDDHRQPYGQANATILLAFERWVTPSSDKSHYDMGMIILDTPIGYKTGWAGLFCGPDDLILRQKIHVTGYPGDKGHKDGRNRGTQLWTMQDQPKRTSSETLDYNIDTAKGQSGAAVWSEILDYRGWYVLGSHAYGVDSPTNENKCNSATRLSSHKMITILKWLENYQFPNMIHPDLPTSQDKRIKTIVKNLKERARQKDPRALYELADYYYLGQKIVDDIDAVKWSWYRDNETNKRIYYGRGLVIPQSTKHRKALKLYAEAATQNHIPALWMVGECYLFGQGIPTNHTNAILHYQKAAEQGYAAAQCALGVLYDIGQGMSQDYGEARKWYEKAAVQGHASAQNSLGVLHHFGQGMSQDYGEARKWYEKAAAQGDADAQYNLGLLHHFGQGMSQDYGEARKWYEKAAVQGHADAQNNLGVLYKNGQGGPRDYDQANKWFHKAAAQGHSNARNNLSSCLIM